MQTEEAMIRDAHWHMIGEMACLWPMARVRNWRTWSTFAWRVWS